MILGRGRLLLHLGAVLLVASCGGTVGDDRSTAPDGDPSAALFDPAVVHDIEMEIADRDLERLDPPSDERVPVRLIVDGEIIDVAGVRLKGGAAQHQGLDAKPGFSIKTDKFVDGEDIRDVSRFTLGNAALDASFVAEHLAYTVFRDAGIPVARTALARVTLNDELLGLYVMRESYDRRWLRRSFEDPEGNLYEAPDEAEALDTGLEPRTNERSNDARDLEAIADVVATASDEDYRDAVQELVDVAEMLTYWAVEAVTGHWDGYLYDVTAPGRVPPPIRPPGNPGINNFYAYHDPVSNQLVIIPHGADLTLGLGGTAWALDPTAPALTPPKANATIAVRLWDQPGFPELLADRVRWVLDEVWDAQSLTAEAERLADLVRADGLSGTREWVDPARFEEALAARKDWIRARGPAVRAELAESASSAEQEQER